MFASIISSPEISKTSTSFKNNPSKLSVLIKISNKFPKHFLQPITEELFAALRINYSLKNMHHQIISNNFESLFFH
jgi:hypothetical protein